MELSEDLYDFTPDMIEGVKSLTGQTSREWRLTLKKHTFINKYQHCENKWELSEGEYSQKDNCPKCGSETIPYKSIANF